MPFGLTIGTERAAALQQSIQDELTKRGYSPDADPVMAEYITIMVINNKTGAQINNELEDLIGSDFDHSFTDWLFLEAAKGATEVDESPQPDPSTSQLPPRDVPPHVPSDTSRRLPNPPRTGVYQQALSQALPSNTTSTHKRSASARSPSPAHPNKARRTDLPTGPRAMLRDGGSTSALNSHANTRSLIERVGGPAGPMRTGGTPNGFVAHDDIQSRIDNIVNSSPEQNMMMAGGFPGMNGAGGMDMSAMAAGMANPLVFQDIIMNQMALMAQMTNMIGGGVGQFGPGYPMQSMPGDMNMYQGGMNAGFQGSQMGGTVGAGGRSRGGGRDRGGPNRGRGGSTTTPTPTPKFSDVSLSKDSTPTQEIPIVAPAPITPSAPTALSNLKSSTPPQRPAYALPERPQSPTLCKFSTKCTNPHCRYAHPSPVATAESGVVLSNEACEKGKDCQDKDCIKAHVSPAVLNAQVVEQAPLHVPTAPQSTTCRFGAACTRPGCTFSHPRPTAQAPSQYTAQCRFGAACTRSGCPFQHPEGRVLPTSFHRGLSTTGPMVNVQTPETGSMGGTASPHRSVKFNKPSGPGLGVKEKLQQQMKEIEERKNEAEKAVREAEAAAGKKDESKPVAIAV